ncbi:M14 family metallopeptidase [Cohnella kolymensis]|uniref:M14 family metallopeptidase n=1 Tax=Cohnella kolymensis TaxID=1590652 RepID=UPI000ABE4AED|nr:M14 family metallopeptidase [Cohnella kolymensis]
MTKGRYVVQQRDTPRRIAQNLGITRISLMSANPQWDPKTPIVPGETINIPLLAHNHDPDTIVMTAAEYGPAQLSGDIQRLSQVYPSIKAGVIGRSVLSQPLHALNIGSGPFLWHFNGACHANEWITSLLLMKFAEDYAKAYERGKTIGGKPAADLFSRCSLWIVPMLNPDGAQLAQEGLHPEHPLYDELLRWNRGSTRFHRWKSNARGVDLNDQFPAHWDEERQRRGVSAPGPRDYGGPAPLSEPEASALAEWTERMDFDAVLALHTQGEEIYWNYRSCEPPEAEQWAHRMAKAAGYRAVYLEGSDAGYKDWFISKFGRPGFTVEAGWGHNPLSLDDFDDIYDDIAKLLAEALDSRRGDSFQAGWGKLDES